MRRRSAELQDRLDQLEQRLDHERRFPLEWVNRRVRDRLGNAVTAGPFAGLRYPDWGLTGVDLYAPKVLGAYEHELHDAVEAAIARTPPVVVNIGAAEGYYAVGLALRLPGSRVLAFDTAAPKLEQLAEIATLNGVRVETRAQECDHAALTELLVPGALVVCDCDGCEADLLDPERVPALRGASVIVETHDYLRPGTTDQLVAAFGPSHAIERVPAQPRYVGDFPQLEADIPLVTRQLAISEFREAPMGWLVVHPLTAA